MIIVMKKNAAAKSINIVVDEIRQAGLMEHVSKGAERVIIGAVGDERVLDLNVFKRLPEVEQALRILHDWQIISREAQQENSTLTVRGVKIGGEQVVNIAKINHLNMTADGLQGQDAVYIDPFFQSSYVYDASNLKEEKDSIRLMNHAVQYYHEQQQPVFVRIRDVRQLDAALNAQVDVLYLGGELMENRTLQKEIGQLNTPVVLCKDKHHQVDDWLIAAEHIAVCGNHQIILGESGTLSLSRRCYNRLDIEAIATVRALSHLPILVNAINLTDEYLPLKLLNQLAIAAGAQSVIIN